MRNLLTLHRGAGLGVALNGLLLLTVAACGGDENGPTSNQTQPPAAPDVAEIQEIVIVSSDQLSFAPETVSLKVGETVRIVLDNSEAEVLHDFTIDEMHVSDLQMEGGTEHMDDHADDPEADVHVAAEPGEKATLEFTPEEAGEYAFYCSVLGHRQGGMEGILMVE